MIRKVLIGVAFVIPIVIAALIAGARPASKEPAVFWAVPEFTLVTQDSAEFDERALGGQVWIAGFVYTHCPDVCPLVTRRMAELRDSLNAAGTQVRFLSVSVDPARDTPAVLREYAKAFDAELPQWVFLTGEPDRVLSLVTNGFKLQAMNPTVHSEHEMEHEHEAAGDYMVSHSDRLVLIDANRQVRGTYSSSDADALAQLRRDLKALGL